MRQLLLWRVQGNVGTVPGCNAQHRAAQPCPACLFPCPLPLSPHPPRPLSPLLPLCPSSQPWRTSRAALATGAPRSSPSTTLPRTTWPTRLVGWLVGRSCRLLCRSVGRGMTPPSSFGGQQAAGLLATHVFVLLACTPQLVHAAATCAPRLHTATRSTRVPATSIATTRTPPPCGLQVLPPRITMRDFEKVIMRARPTVSKDDLAIFEKFTSEFGEEAQ